MPSTVPCPICGTSLEADTTLCPMCGADYSAATLGTGDSPTIVRLRHESPVDAQPLIEDLVQTLSPRFQGLRELGRGGMGLVFIGRDPLLKRDVAIKVLAPGFIDDTLARERFLREAQAAAAVAHPNVVSIFQVGELNTTRIPYFVMQFVEGNTIEQEYPQGTAVSEPVARRIIAEVGAALGAAHARGLVHRDIKPSNVMLDPHTGRAIVLDFGISASVRQLAADEKLTAPGIYVGTPRYMSPEQASGDPVTDKSDVYSLGCLAYELLSGRKVFDAKSVLALLAAHMRDVPRPLTETRPELDRELGALVMRCLEKDPLKRPAAGEVAQRLTPGAGVLLEWPPPGLEPIHRKLASVSGWLWASSATLLITIFSLVLAGPALQTVHDSATTLLLLLIGVAAILFFLESARRAIRLGRAATAAVRDGYSWTTVAETIADPDGDSGALITGSRRFAMLSPTQRSTLRRGRLVRAWSLLIGGMSTVPVLILLIIAASLIVMSPSMVFVALLPPIAAVGIALHRALIERRLAPPLRTARVDSTRVSIISLAPDWNESFARARAEQPLGAGTRRRPKLGLAVGASVALIAALVILLIAPIVSVVVGGAFIYQIVPFNVGSVDEKTRLAETSRSWALTKDPNMTLEEAGRAFRGLAPPRAVTGVFEMRPTQAPARRAWTDNRPGAALFATAKPVEPWVGPSVTGVLEAAKRGFSPAEMAWLKMLATDPGWRDWGIFARAPRVDLLGSRVKLPFSSEAIAEQVPLPRFVLIKDLAFASVSRAAYHLALHQVDSAEVDLRETISVGFAMTDNATYLIDQLMGVGVINIGRDALSRLYTLTGRPEGTRLKVTHDSAVAARDARREIAELDSARGRSSVPSGPAARRALWLLANQKTASRPLRLMALDILSFAPCTNFRELLFGPDADVRESMSKLEGELALYPADTAVFQLLRERTERGVPHVSWQTSDRVALGVASVAGFVLRNPRIRGCSEILLSF